MLGSRSKATGELMAGCKAPMYADSLCGRPVKNGDFCGLHDHHRKAKDGNNKTRRAVGELAIELAKHIMRIPGAGERDLEIDVIKMPTPTQWASCCWAAQSILRTLEGK